MASEASPNRTSSQPPANRILNFGRQNVRMSIENASPFKPKRVIRRSPGAVRNDQPVEDQATSPGRDSKPELPAMESGTIEEEAEEVEVEAGAENEESHRERTEEQQQLDNQLADDEPVIFNNDDDYYDTERQSNEPDLTEAFEQTHLLLQTTPTANPSAKKGRGRPRKSHVNGDGSVQHTPQTAQMIPSSRKRDRTELENDEGEGTLQSIEQGDQDVSQISTASDQSAKRARGRPRKSDITVHDQTVQTIDEGEVTHQSIEQGDNDVSQVSATSEQPAKRKPGRPRKSDITVLHDQTEQTIDPALLAHGDSYLAPVNEEDEVEIAPASPVTKKKPGRKPKAQKAAQQSRAPRERDPNQAMRRTTSASPDRALTRSPSKRAGSVSNVNLRASTPHEDAHQHMSRSGRPILKPLKHWAGESYVWKNGEIEGIIRADEIKTPKGKKKKKAKGRRRAPRAGGRGGSNDLDSIAEESDTESTVPDDWEEQVGVIAGTVAAWDPESQQGNPEAPIREGTLLSMESFAHLPLTLTDIAFAASSIITRDVAGSAFQYAKIMTLPFFGSGIVELPPEGFKRAKNSRKMQMVFFVHEGKVLVTVGPPSTEQNGRGASGSETETNEFAISKGGVWVVPRGMPFFLSVFFPPPFAAQHTLPPSQTPVRAQSIALYCLV